MLYQHPWQQHEMHELQSVRDIASLLYKRMMENMGYGQERLKDIVEKGAEEEKPAAAPEEEAKEQRQGPTAQPKNNNSTMMMSDMMRLQNKIGIRRKTCEGIQSDWKFKLQDKDDHGQHHTTH